MRLLIKLPTRGRAERFFSTLQRYRALLSGKVPTRFVVTCDEDDTKMNTPIVRQRLAAVPNLTVFYGNSGSKVAAINADIPWPPDWDVILVASDDMVPVEPGYDWVICSEMAWRYPDMDGVLWFNDGYVGRKLNTLPILGRTYYSRTRYVYQPEYKSLWCDNEFMCVAERLGRQTYIDRVIIRHEHPGNVKGIDHDETYKRNNKDHWRDKAHYDLRAARGFDL